MKKKILAAMTAAALCGLSGCGEESSRQETAIQQANGEDVQSSFQSAETQANNEIPQNTMQITNAENNTATEWLDTVPTAINPVITEAPAQVQEPVQAEEEQVEWQVMDNGEVLEVMTPSDMGTFTGNGFDGMEEACKAYLNASCSPCEHSEEFFNMVPEGYIRYLTNKYNMTETQLRKTLANKYAEQYAGVAAEDFEKMVSFQVTEKTELTDYTRYNDYLGERGIERGDLFYRLHVVYVLEGKDYKENHDKDFDVYQVGGKWYPYDALRAIEKPLSKK